MVPRLKTRRLSCLLRLSLAPEIVEIAETFMFKIESLALLKCRLTGLSTSLSLTERRCSANLSETSDSLTDEEFMAFAAEYTVNEVKHFRLTSFTVYPAA